VTEVIREDIKKFLESNENENTTYTAKAMLSRKFTDISTYIKIKTETSKINNLLMYLKLLEKHEQTKPKTSRWKEIIKIWAKIHEIETTQTVQRISETKSWFFEKINKIDKVLANMTKSWREKTQINNIRDEKWYITTNTNKIQRIITEHFENLY
jgi:hypothetical protein